MSTSGDEQATGMSRARRIRGTAVWLRILAVLSAGFVLYWSGPPRDLWWLAPLAFAAFAACLHRRRSGAGFGYGLLFGFAFLLPLLGWLQDFLGPQFGPWPWLGVVLIEAVFFGLAGAGMARVSRLRGAPIWMASVFVAAESLRSSVPFGGFPWGRLAFGQTEGVLLPLASLGGTALVSFAVALIGTSLAVLVLRLAGRPRGWVVPVITAAVPVLAGVAVLPVIDVGPESGTATVGVVQGNAPDLGLDLLYADDVLHDNHVRGADRLAEDIDQGLVAKPDFVVLPEQVGSWGAPPRDPELARVTDRLDVPVMVGGLTKDGDGGLYNRVVRWAPGSGAGEYYTKQHLVPFAETIPMRSVARVVSPFVDRFDRDMTPGTEPGVLAAGPALLGVGLCYDVAYDDVFRGAVRDGATVLAVPTNNAWYGQSEMTYQHVAMSQLRAVEHGRAVVVSATSGVSAIVRPDGVVTEETGQFTEQNLVAEVPLRTTLTPATRLGGIPMWGLSALGVLAIGLTFRRRHRAGAS
ncbi:apolipoprotein N-acyltransferase [Parasphingorhabdus pacifica]